MQVKIALYGRINQPSAGYIFCEIIDSTDDIRCDPDLVYLGTGEYELPAGVSHGVSQAGCAGLFDSSGDRVLLSYNKNNRSISTGTDYLKLLNIFDAGEPIYGRPYMSAHRL